MKDTLAASKDTKQISADQNSTCISQNTLQTKTKLRCSSRVSLNEENKLVCPETNPEHRNSLESFDKNKNREVSSNTMNCTFLDTLNPKLYEAISTVNEAITPNKNGSVATGEQKSSKTLKHFKKAYLAFDIGIKKKAKIDQTDPSAATASKSNESLTSSIPEISQGKESERQCNPYKSVVSPTPEEIKFNKAAMKCNVLSILPFNSKKQKGKEICLTNSVASEPMNNRLVTEEVPLEKRILLTNSDKEPSQETVSLSMEEKEHPTTVTISESVPGVQKIIGVQKSICSAETQSVQESISVYEPAAVTLNSTNITDNKNTQLKVVSLSENICTNLIDTTHDSTTLNKSTEVNLNEIQQAKVLNTKNSDKSGSQLYFFTNLKPLYKLQYSNNCENAVRLSNKQWNYPYNCYYFPKNSESISTEKKTGKRCTKLKKNTNQIRRKEIRIAPKIPCGTAVVINNINKPLFSGTNTQPENNANKKPISSMTLVNFNETSCPLLLPLAEETKEVPVIKPVQKYSDIKIIDVRTDYVNEQGITGVSSSTDDIVQIKPSETNSKRISKSTNDLLQIQSSEIKIVGTPENINDVQIPSFEMDTMNQDSNPSKVPDSSDVESSISELIDLNPRVLQVEVQMPQTVPETTQQQKPNPCVVEQDKMMPSAMKNILNATAARKRNKRKRTVEEKQKMMLLRKEAMQKTRIDMLQNVFQVLNHCARKCASEDFEIWFKREELPTKKDLEDVQSQQEITHTVTENPGEWLDLLHVLKVEPVSENKTPTEKKSLKTVTRPKRKRKRPKVAACGSVQKRKSNLDNETTVADFPGTSSKNRKDEPNDLVMIESSSNVVVDLEDVQSQQEVTHTLTENPGECVGLLKVLKVKPVSENKRPKRRKSSNRLTQRKRKWNNPEIAACGSVQKRKSNSNDDAIVADLPKTSSKNIKVEPDDLVMIESSSNVVDDLEDVQSQQEITHTVTEKPRAWFDILNELQVEPVSENNTPKRRLKTVTQPKRNCKIPEVAAYGSVQKRKSNLDDDATVADLPETSSKNIKVEPDDLVMIESSSNVVDDLEDVQSQQEITHTVTKKPRAWFDLLNELQVEPVSEKKTRKRRRSSMTVTQPKRKCERPEVAFCGSVQKRKSNMDDYGIVADLPETSSKNIKVEPDDLVMIESSSNVVDDLEDVQSQQEVIHTLTEDPGECAGLLKVLKVEPVSENETPKRRWKTVTQPKRNCKIPEVAAYGSVQKRKSNSNDDAIVADLPKTSSKNIKVEPDDLVMIESSSSVVSFNEPVGNLALPTTEVQEVSFMKHDDKNLSEAVLGHGLEIWKTDTINDSETYRSSRRRKMVPETYKIARPYKKHKISTHVRKKLKSSRKWITESLKNDESQFTFTEDVIVKSEDMETKPDVDNYDIWKDGILCRDFGIQECYVRLRKIDDLYPSGYTRIDFNAIFS